jgi:uncharacterized lipoprotein YddW (UPF0748 family)
MDKILQLLILLCLSANCQPHTETAQDSTFVPSEKDFLKREFRAVWVTTLDNKDFPSRKGLSTQKQQDEIVEMVEFYQKKGFNALVFQVRPAADAFYSSSYEPWSEWVTGRQGDAPKPFYDPLAFMIQECHKRGMELHAWFNPYRTQFTKYSHISQSHISKLKPHWVVNYGGSQQLDPGLPEVQQYIQAVIIDVVKRYDVDGIHFDDYFYPYRVGKTDFPDDQTFALYKGSFLNKQDWRRENINKLVKNTSEAIAKLKPFVKFGISPLGVWRNQKDDPRGSATAVGQPSYDYLGADILKWLEKGWIDYVAPQMYWSIGHERADYRVLVEWWAKNSYQRHIYAGQASYKAVMQEADIRWKNRAELSRQMRLNRTFNLQGSIFFRSKPLMRSWVSDTLQKNFFKYPALIPAMPWKDAIPPLPPDKPKLLRSRARVVLNWLCPAVASDGQIPQYYAIYKAPKGEKIDLNNPKHLVSIQKELTWTDKATDKEMVAYLVTSFDRLHNESTPVELKSSSAEDF